MGKTLSLRQLLIISFTGLVGATVAVVGLLAWNASERVVSSMAEQLMLEIGERIDQRVDAQLAQLRRVVQINAALIRRGRLDWRDGPAMEQLFSEELGLFGGVTTIAQVTERREFRLMMRAGPEAWILRRMDASTGFRLNRYRADAEGKPGELLETRTNFDPHNDPPGQSWYLATLNSGKGRWGLTVSLSRGQLQPELFSHYSEPFEDSAGVVRGVQNAGMSLTEIGTFLQDLEISANGQAFLIDREGLLIATSSGEIPFDRRPLPNHQQNVNARQRRLAASRSVDPITAETTRQLRMAGLDLSQVTTSRSFGFRFQGRRYLATMVPMASNPSNPDWLILVVAPLQDFTSLLWERLVLPGLLVLGALGFAILLGLAAAAWISRPVQRLSAATRRLEEGHGGESLPATPIRELQELGDAFSTMARRLQDAFTRLQAAEQELAGENLRLEERVSRRTEELESARLQLEKALAQRSESEAKYRGMFEQSPLGVALFDPATGSMLEVNEWLLQFLSCSRDQLIHLGWTGVTHPDDLAGEQSQVARLHAGEIDGFQLEKRYMRPDGTPVWANLTVASIAIGPADQRLHLCLVEDINARKIAEAQIVENERQLQQILENMPTPVAISQLGTDGKITYLNSRFRRSLGYDLQDIPTVNDWAQRAYPDATYRNASMDWWSRAVETTAESAGQVESKEFQVCCKDGAQRDVIISTTVLEDFLLVCFLDITDRKRAEARLAESEERFRRAFDDANAGMCLVDLQGFLLKVNAGMTAIFGYSRHELEGMSVNALALEEDQSVSPAFMETAIHGGSDRAVFMKRYHDRQGRIIHCEIASSLVRDRQGQPLYFISQVQDITQRKHAEVALAQSMLELEEANQKLHRLASIDELTGLLNRRELLDRLESLLIDPNRHSDGEQLALIFCDLDQFKEINDTLGHAAGDVVLCSVAERIRRSIRSDDLAARVGGDEMVVVLRSVADLAAAVAVAETIAAAISLPIIGREFQTVITASLGVTLARPGELLDELMARADMAMYQAKQTGRGRVIPLD